MKYCFAFTAMTAAAAVGSGCGFLAGVDFFDAERVVDAGPAEIDAAFDGPEDAGSADAAGATRLCVFGGTADGSRLPETSTPLCAVIRDDGTLSPWTTAGVALPNARLYAPAITGGGFVALAGGITRGPGERKNFLLVKTPDLTYAESADVFTTARARAGAVMVGGNVFVFGGTGTGGGPTLASVERGSVARDGVGVFAPARSLPTPLAKMAVASRGRDVFIVGGDDGKARSASILRATLEGSDLSAYTKIAELPAGRTYAQATFASDTLLVVGGEADGSVPDVVAYRSNGAGGFEAPLNGEPLPAPTSQHALVVVGRHAYVVGGASTNGPVATVYVADVETTGLLTRWRTTTSLPEPLHFHAAAAF